MWLWGGSSGGEPTVDALVDELELASDPQRQLAIVSTLRDKSSERQHHESVGRAIPRLVRLVQEHPRELALVRPVIEAIASVLKCPENSNSADVYVELVNTQTLVQDAKALPLLLDLLDETDFYVRYNTVQILVELITNQRLVDLQKCLLSTPASTAKIMDLLSDAREAIRNEGLLLLIDLSRENEEIQKLVVFSGAFEILFEIISAEGKNNGGIVVIDCLQLVKSLLRDSPSNQNYFRETSCISSLPDLLAMEGSDMWVLTDDKTRIICLTMEIISVLLSGSNVYSSQTMLSQQSIMQILIKLSLGRVNSLDVRRQALRTLGDLIRDHAENRNKITECTVDAEADPSVPPRPVVIRLLTICLKARDPSERWFASYVFQCYLYDNPEGQLALGSTLAPHPDQDNLLDDDEANLSIGRQLVSGILKWRQRDPQSCWHCCLVLSFILTDNSECKSLILRFPLDWDSQGADNNLLTTCMSILCECLKESNPPHLICVGLLRVICTWVSECPPAVDALLKDPNTIPFLVEQVIRPGGDVHLQGLCGLLFGLLFLNIEDREGASFTWASLQGLIVHRIGVNLFLEKLERLRKSNAFIFGEKERVMLPSDIAEDGGDGSEVHLYDYDFTCFFKGTHDVINRELKRAGRGSKKSVPPSPMKGAPHSLRAARLFTDAPRSIPGESHHRDTTDETAAKEQVIKLKTELAAAQTTITHLKASLSDSEDQRKREVAALREELSKVKHGSDDVPVLSTSPDELSSLSHAYNELEALLDTKDATIADLRVQLTMAKSTEGSKELEGLKSTNAMLQKTITQIQGEKFRRESADQRKIEQLEDEVRRLQAAKTKAQTDESQAPVPSSSPSDAALRDLQRRFQALEREQTDLVHQHTLVEMERDSLAEQLRLLREKYETK